MSNTHITNLNKALKDIKSEVMADFVCINQTGIIIVTNKVASPLDLQTIGKYIKNTNFICLSQCSLPTPIKIVLEDYWHLLPLREY